MGRKSQIRPQAQKDRELTRVHRVQNLRYSNAAGPHISKARYDRNESRALMQSGNYDF